MEIISLYWYITIFWNKNQEVFRNLWKFLLFNDLNQGIAAFFLAKNIESYVIINNNAKKAQNKPQTHIRQAYLTEDIKRHIGIIPHIKVQTDIKDIPKHQLKRCDNKRTDKHLAQERHRFSLVHKTDNNKAKPAKHEHTPVRASPPKQLNNNICQSPNIKQYKQL